MNKNLVNYLLKCMLAIFFSQKALAILLLVISMSQLGAQAFTYDKFRLNFFREQDDSPWNTYSLGNLHPTVIKWQNTSNSTTNRESYSEGPVRRAEIVFLISLPFSLLLNIGATALVYQAATGNTNMPSSVWAFAGSSALLFSGAIAWHDHLTVFSENNLSRERRMELRYSAFLTH